MAHFVGRPCRQVAELIGTELTDDAVVMAGPGTAARRANGKAAVVGEMMTTIVGTTLTAFVNYSSTASGVELRRGTGRPERSADSRVRNVDERRESLATGELSD